MRSQLSLALTGETLTLRLSPAERPSGWLARLRYLARWRTNRHPRHPVHKAADQVLSLPLGQLGETLEQAWAALHKWAPQDLDALDLSVQLGLAYTRLGLLHLPAESGTESRSTVIDGYVQAWIRQMWGVDPAAQILRWDRVEGGNDILISCIDRPVFVELEAFAQRHGLRFVSCKPAVLNALDLSNPSAENEATSRTLVWTEPSATAQRASQVQMLHCVGAQPRALWRGWIPAPEGADTPDDALQGAIRRFSAMSSVKVDAPLVFKKWDQSGLGPSAAGAGT